MRSFSYPGTDPLHRSRDDPGKLVFVGTAEVREPYVQKHNLHTTKQKTGVIPQRAKKWVGACFWQVGSGMATIYQNIEIPAYPCI
ncbi:hypothetical protein CHT99_07735 [Sphingobacterium cellulitidis]|nr:hypothetical protein CHT99_07735 [Sphingobacterium cellulitidis]